MTRKTITEKLLLDSLFEVAAIYLSRLQYLSLKSTLILLRKRLRMSQRTVAERAKIPPSTLSRIESGKVTPSLATLEKIFKALFCDVALIPIPWRDLDLIVKKQIHLLAKKRVQYLKGTMALELQQPKDEVIRELISREEKEILEKENFDIWRAGEFHETE